MKAPGMRCVILFGTLHRQGGKKNHEYAPHIPRSPSPPPKETVGKLTPRCTPIHWRRR
jgi:hypothetical protein